MSEVKRYGEKSASALIEFEDEDWGEYVHYSDHAAALARVEGDNAKLREEAQESANVIMQFMTQLDEVKKDNAKLREKLNGAVAMLMVHASTDPDIGELDQFSHNLTASEEGGSDGKEG